mmetsp:Transcript_18731/g.21524  ORF Transcript_18731/g.21524 Transcript_18731/m.21524 type:complete len:81 (+) Transcript_18731:272-514(+)
MSAKLFKHRRRSFVILIPFERSDQQLISQIPSLFRIELADETSELELSEDQISLKNSILFKKLLMSQRHKNSFLCKSGMK